MNAAFMGTAMTITLHNIIFHAASLRQDATPLTSRTEKSHRLDNAQQQRQRPDITIDNHFASLFATIVSANDTILPEVSEDGKMLNHPPFVIEDGRLLCHRKHKDEILTEPRLREFVEMLTKALMFRMKLVRGIYLQEFESGLPFLLLGGDGNGCELSTRTDLYNFPRLTWSIPAPKFEGDGWCKAISVPTYSTWESFKNIKSEKRWKVVLQDQRSRYPWASKINKAVWRGSTTSQLQSGYDISKDLQYITTFNGTARAQLVQTGVEHPDVIDASFTNFVYPFEAEKDELSTLTRVTERIRFADQMKYKGASIASGSYTKDWTCIALNSKALN